MSNQVRLRYISDSGLEWLKQTFDDNLNEYIKGNQEYFLSKLDEMGVLLESAYIVDDFSEKLVFGNNLDEADYINVGIIHQALKCVPKHVLMDDRFWAGLNHTIMWEYIQKRRKEEAFKKDIPNQREKVFNSFFTHTKHGKKRGTYVNCVSRLWWAGHLSYDENMPENHYWLVDEIQKTGFASTLLLLSSSNILNRKETINILLKKIHKLRAEGRKVTRNDIVAGVRYLNLVAGSTIIDTVDKNEIEQMLNNFYDKHF